MQKLKNNEARPKFTGSYKKACTISHVFGNFDRIGQQMCPAQLSSNEFGPQPRL